MKRTMCLSLLLVACSSSSASNNNEEANASTVFGIQLDPSGARAGYQIAVKVEPPFPSAQLVQPVAGEVATALDACSAQGKMTRIEASAVVQFHVRAGKLEATPGNATGEPVQCLSEALAGKSLAPLAAGTYSLMLEIAEKPAQAAAR